MRFTVGGRALDMTYEQVLERMTGIDPEPFRKHVVEIKNTVYPPKQVFATITGWERQSFTTLEAQRVLTRLGFTCRVAVETEDGRGGWSKVGSRTDADERDEENRIDALESAVVTAQVAIASLHSRIDALESAADEA